MKWSLFVLALCILCFTASANVTYNTSGGFLCTNGSIGGGDSVSGCNGPSTPSTMITLDDNGGVNDEKIELIFNNIPLPGATVNAKSGTTAPYGSITTQCIGTGTGCTSATPTVINVL